MKKFKGFEPGKPETMEIHTGLISEAMPLIDSLAEMKVVLFTYRALYQKTGRTRYLRHDDYAGSDLLMQDATFPDTETLVSAIDRAVTHGILLRADVQLDTGDEALYFLNTDRGRYGVQQVKAGRWKPVGERAIEILPERPNIYTLYEENIGPLTPLIADELKDADDTYSPEWVAEAIRLAVENNARSWRYILAILERWKQEGRTNEKSGRTGSETTKDYRGGKWSDIIES